MTPAVRQEVHDLGAERRAELLAEIYLPSSPRGHLRGSSTVSRPVESQDFLDHVHGRERIGVVPFVDRTHVAWMKADLDCRNWDMDPDGPDSIEMIATIVEELALCGIASWIERSRAKGWHIWAFFDAPLSAKNARAFLIPISVQAVCRKSWGDTAPIPARSPSSRTCR